MTNLVASSRLMSWNNDLDAKDRAILINLPLQCLSNFTDTEKNPLGHQRLLEYSLRSSQNSDATGAHPLISTLVQRPKPRVDENTLILNFSLKNNEAEKRSRHKGNCNNNNCMNIVLRRRSSRRAQQKGRIYRQHYKFILFDELLINGGVKKSWFEYKVQVAECQGNEY